MAVKTNVSELQIGTAIEISVEYFNLSRQGLKFNYNRYLSIRGGRRRRRIQTGSRRMEGQTGRYVIMKDMGSQLNSMTVCTAP